MRTLFIALSVLVLVTAGSLRADVAPFPSWRLAANDTITRVVQGGDVVYVGGRFSRLGEGLTPFVGAIDRATLAFAPRTGCSTEAGSPIDRRFRVVLPPRIDAGNVTVTDPVEANGHAYFRFTRSTFPRGGELQLTVEVDGVTGAMKRYWPELVGTTILPHGVTPAGRIVASATTGFDARGHRGVGVRKHGASRMAGPAIGWAAMSYQVEAGTAPALANIGSVPVNGLSFGAAVPPGLYHVRVRAVNVYGTSGPGDEVIVDVA